MNDIEKVEKVIKQLKLLSTHNVAPNIMNEAIQTIRKLQEDCERYHEWGFCEGYEKAKQQIPKWHFVADGDLPNESGEYYCYVDYDGNKFYNIEEIDCDGFFKEWNLSGKVKVIAWMELPKFEEVK